MWNDTEYQVQQKMTGMTITINSNVKDTRKAWHVNIRDQWDVEKDVDCDSLQDAMEKSWQLMAEIEVEIRQDIKNYAKDQAAQSAETK